MIIPVLPRLILNFLGDKMTTAADWNGWFALVFALMQFVFSPVLGVLSDRFGRRPIILMSNLGLGLDYVVMALAPTIGWLFLGRIISGVTTSSIPTAMAYIADVTPKEKRAQAFGLIGMAFGLGFAFGPAIGGILGGINPRLVFWVSAGLSLTNWIYGYFFVPESLPMDRRQAVSLKRANPCRLARSAPLSSRALATRAHPISRLHRSQCFWRLGPLRNLSLQLGRGHDRAFAHGGGDFHRADIGSPYRANG